MSKPLQQLGERLRALIMPKNPRKTRSSIESCLAQTEKREGPTPNPPSLTEEELKTFRENFKQGRFLEIEWDQIDERRDWYVAKSTTGEEKDQFVLALLEEFTSATRKTININLQDFVLLAVLYSEDKTPFVKHYFGTYIGGTEKEEESRCMRVMKLIGCMMGSMFKIHYNEHLDPTFEIRSDKDYYQLDVILDFIERIMQRTHKEINLCRDPRGMIDLGNHPILDCFQTIPEMALEMGMDLKFVDRLSDIRLRAMAPPEDKKYLSDIRLRTMALGEHEKAGSEVVLSESVRKIPYCEIDHQLRTAHSFYKGIEEDYLFLPITPGYCGLYDEVGHLIEIYKLPTEPIKPNEGIERHFQASFVAHPATHVRLTRRLSYWWPKLGWGNVPSHTAQSQLKAIGEAKKRVAEEGGTFLFDFSKLDPRGLTPAALDELTRLNLKTLRKIDQRKSELAIVRAGELISQTSAAEASPEDVYFWKMLTRLPVRERLEENLGINITKYPPWMQLFFLRFIRFLNFPEYKKVEKFLERGNKSNRLIVLAATEGNPQLIRETILLDNFPAIAEAIFEQFAQITSLFEQEKERLMQKTHANPNLKGKINLYQLYKAIDKRRIEFLQEYIKKVFPLTHLDEIKDELKRVNERYQIGVIVAGAVFSASCRSEDGKPLTPEEVNELSERLNVHCFSGGEDEIDPAAQEMILSNTRKTHERIDSGWTEDLIEQFPEATKDPTAKLFTAQVNGAYQGSILRRKVGEKHYFLGSFYVLESFRGGFGVGGYLDALARNDVEPDAIFEGRVAAANLEMICHIISSGYTIQSIVQEGRSGPLMKVKHNPNLEFKTKKMSRQQIREINQGEMGDKSIAKIHLDTSKTDYIQTLKSSLAANDNLYITQFFYDPDATNTCIVLEEAKPVENAA